MVFFLDSVYAHIHKHIYMHKSLYRSTENPIYQLPNPFCFVLQDPRLVGKWRGMRHSDKMTEEERQRKNCRQWSSASEFTQWNMDTLNGFTICFFSNWAISNTPRCSKINWVLHAFSLLWVPRRKGFHRTCICQSKDSISLMYDE